MAKRFRVSTLTGYSVMNSDNDERRRPPGLTAMVLDHLNAMTVMGLWRSEAYKTLGRERAKARALELAQALADKLNSEHT